MNTNESKPETVTRAEAFKLGLLVDLTPIKHLVGLRTPIAISRKAFLAAVRPECRVRDSVGVLAAMTMEVFAQPELSQCERLEFKTAAASGGEVTLQCLMGPDDDGSNVLTIICPDEPVHKVEG